MSYDQLHQLINAIRTIAAAVKEAEGGPSPERRRELLTAILEADRFAVRRLAVLGAVAIPGQDGDAWALELHRQVGRALAGVQRGWSAERLGEVYAALVQCHEDLQLARDMQPLPRMSLQGLYAIMTGGELPSETDSDEADTQDQGIEDDPSATMLVLPQEMFSGRAWEGLGAQSRRLLAFMATRERADLDELCNEVWGRDFMDVNETTMLGPAISRANKYLTNRGAPRNLSKVRGESVVIWTI